MKHIQELISSCPSSVWTAILVFSPNSSPSFDRQFVVGFIFKRNIYQRVTFHCKGISSMRNAPLAFSVSYSLVLHVKYLCWGFVLYLGGLAKQELKGSLKILPSATLESLFSATLPFPSPMCAGNLWGDLKKGNFPNRINMSHDERQKKRK